MIDFETLFQVRDGANRRARRPAQTRVDYLRELLQGGQEVSFTSHDGNKMLLTADEDVAAFEGSDIFSKLVVDPGTQAPSNV
jgi:hypothetical protein